MDNINLISTCLSKKRNNVYLRHSREGIPRRGANQIKPNTKTLSRGWSRPACRSRGANTSSPPPPPATPTSSSQQSGCLSALGNPTDLAGWSILKIKQCYPQNLNRPSPPFHLEYHHCIYVRLQAKLSLQEKRVTLSVFLFQCMHQMLSKLWNVVTLKSKQKEVSILSEGAGWHHILPDLKCFGLASSVTLFPHPVHVSDVKTNLHGFGVETQDKSLKPQLQADNMIFCLSTWKCFDLPPWPWSFHNFCQSLPGHIPSKT